MAKKSIGTDVLVIGGGATGSGLALDLALRGLRVILAEAGGVAEGTSGRYHGLLHSGGRYAVRDPESAAECALENRILRKIMPHAIEDTGGLFISLPDDPPEYADEWLAACHKCGIPAEEISTSEALRLSPNLNRAVKRAFWVPDGSCDSFDAINSLFRAAEANGAEVWLYSPVVEILREGDKVVGARVKRLREGEEVEIRARWVVNSAGPWAAKVATMAGCKVGMKLSRGALIAMNVRWTHIVLNRCRMPSDGDILVPVGTVSIIGTTSVTVQDPADTRVERWEIEKLLAEGDAMVPGLAKARALRCWAGVRPLYEPDAGEADGEGREVKRTFTVLDHEERDGIGNFTSILGGKFTTYRLMAEKTADLVCAKLGVNTQASTANYVLPDPHDGIGHHYFLGARLRELERGPDPGELICECEIVTRAGIEHALRNGSKTLNDLRRDLRVGMGPCQGAFCAFRTAAIRQATLGITHSEAIGDLESFLRERWKGFKPLLWGHNLRQALLAESNYRRILGLPMPDGPVADTAQPQHIPQAEIPPAPELPDGKGKKVIVIGMGIAGLTAALTALRAGAQVHLVAGGLGKLHISPGWLEILDAEGDLSDAIGRLTSERPDHPYALAGPEALRDGMAIVLEAAARHGLEWYGGFGQGMALLTLAGLRRRVALAPKALAQSAVASSDTLIVGFKHSGGKEWRDFYPHLIAAGLGARAVEIEMPSPGRFDAWPQELARRMENPAIIGQVAAEVRRHLGGASAVGFPAVLGLYMHRDVLARLQDEVGVPVFEIPTLPPSVPGMRLYEALRKELLQGGAEITIGAKVVRGVTDGDRCVGIAIGTVNRERILRANAVIMATGGLFGGGLESDHKGKVWEPIFGLPVANVMDRDKWFGQFLDSNGQPVHKIGLRVDNSMRPLDESGGVALKGLHLAGRQIAGYDPYTEGCSEGVDIATGFKAAGAALAD